MSLGNVFDIAGMGMSAQSVRLNTTASNLANAQAASSNTDEVYRARHPVFETVRRDVMNASYSAIPSIMDESSIGLRVIDSAQPDWTQSPVARFTGRSSSE